METTREFLERREKELMADVGNLRAQLRPKEVELAEVRRARAAINKSGLSATTNLGRLGEVSVGSSLVTSELATDFSTISESISAAIRSISTFSDAETDSELPLLTTVSSEVLEGDSADLRLASPYRHLTMKELAVKALAEHFPAGATARQLLQFFSDAWDRDIKRENLSPQLSRLMKAGIIKREGRVWSLARRNKALADSSESAS